MTFLVWEVRNLWKSLINAIPMGFDSCSLSGFRTYAFITEATSHQAAQRKNCISTTLCTYTFCFLGLVNFLARISVYLVFASGKLLVEGGFSNLGLDFLCGNSPFCSLAKFGESLV